MNISKLFSGLIAACLLATMLIPPAGAQESTNELALRQLSEEFSRYMDEHRPRLYYDMLRSTDPAQAALNKNPDIQLMYIDDNGMPVYYGIHNLVAAQTISTSRVWPGGGAGYSLSGSGTAASKFAIWDAGGVLLTHQELTGRVSNADGHSGSHWHSTFVGGTLAASGVQANAKGMSYQANLNSYDWASDVSEMTTAASNGLLVSNHSYGSIGGWYYDGANWYWYGTTSISTTEDYTFGFYTSSARQWDQIAYNAPNYLIVKSAGNDRTDYGPGPGGGHYYWSGSAWTWSTATRDPDGGTDGYDCIGYNGTSKNILTVGAVNDIPAGYSQPGDVVQASFSSWGPTDDGRIKPDIVGNGVGLYSCYNTSNSAYATASGTSASSPNVAGSINLLIRHYETVKSATPRSATMKAIVIHTADEAGSYDGPDYQSGWGLMNTETAADLISLNPSQIIQDNLTNGSSDQHNLTLGSAAELRATIVWTDQAGTSPPASLNPSTPMLVRDLDLRLQHVPSGTTYYPWRLDRTNPANAATKGDNAIDNVEVIDVHCAPAGAYIATISHKGVLTTSQNYTLCWSTRTAPDPCAVEPGNLDFGSIEMLTYLDKTFTITTTGCDTLQGTVSETSDHYSIVSGGGSYSLAPGENLVVTVRYQPQTLGVHSVTVETGDAACGDVFCTGFAYEPPPACLVEPDTLDFGTVEIGKDSTLTFDITNTGYGTLTGSVSESCPAFMVISGSGSYALTHGQVRTVTIVFFPSAVQQYTCTIETGTATCADVFCTGYGDNPPECSIDLASVDFGTVFIGNTKDTTITITNTGGFTLDGTVSEVCDHYSIVTGAGPYSLTNGQSHLVKVRFEPAATGTHNCSIETGSALCGDISCTGYGDNPPACSVDPASVDFGTVLVGNTKDTTITITNTGGSTLAGTVSEACDHYSIVLGGGAYSLTNGQSHLVKVRFEPASMGTHNCSIETGDALCADVTCTGMGDVPPACVVDPDTLQFGTVILSDSLELEFIITNTGGGTLAGTVSEACEHYSIVSGAGPYALGNDDTVHVVVKFKPAAGGELLCSVETGAVECADVACIGTGDDVTGIGSSQPPAFDLFQNYPNPFKSETQIRFSLDREGHVALRIFDIAGKHVRTILDRGMDPGIHLEAWDGRDGAGNIVASGMYFYQLKMGSRIVTRKAVFLR